MGATYRTLSTIEIRRFSTLDLVTEVSAQELRPVTSLVVRFGEIGVHTMRARERSEDARTHPRWRSTQTSLSLLQHIVCHTHTHKHLHTHTYTT